MEDVTATELPATATLKAVVCDDDPMIRTVIRRVAGMAGVEVVAEADNAEEAVELVARSGAQELILDLALASGRGETALDLVRARVPRCRTIVFSAFVGDADKLRAAGADEVVDKPDFGRLEEVLASHARHPSDEGERRHAPAARPLPHTPAYLSPSGAAPPGELNAMLDALIPGDAVMAVSPDGLPQVARMHGSVIAADLLLHAARVATEALRAQDRVVVDDDGVVILLVLKASTEVVKVVWQRIQDAWAASGAPADLRAGYSVVAETDGPRRAHPAARDALDRAMGRGSALELG